MPKPTRWASCIETSSRRTSSSESSPESPTSPRSSTSGSRAWVAPSETTAATSQETPVEIVGTPDYLAPEATFGKVDERSDIYAVGGLLYWLLTGTRVFETASISDAIRAHRSESPEAPSERAPGRQIPTALDELVLRCLDKEPDARPPNAQAIVDVLDAFLAVHPWNRKASLLWWAEVDTNPAEALGVADTMVSDEQTLQTPDASELVRS